MTPHASLPELARLIHGSVDPTADVPTIHTDSGRVRLGITSWHLYRTGRVEPPLAPWDAPVEDVASAFWFVAGEFSGSERAA